jgi:predicted TIM-barrel fold metal-dependent hydrolase
MRLLPIFVAAVGALCATTCAAQSCPAPAPKYQGPLFDAMAQVESRIAGWVLPGMDKAGVARMALFARLHPKRSGERDVLALKQRHPERFVLGTPKPFDQRDDLSSGFVAATISGLDSGAYRFVGELLFAHADKRHGEQTMTGERFIGPEGKNVHRLLAALKGRSVPVMTHWEVYNWSRDWAAFDALYAAFPDVTFIWPHAGFGSAAQVETVVAARPNVMVTLSKKEKNVHDLSDADLAAKLAPGMLDGCERLVPEWRRLLEAYPDRFMFATDAHKDARWLGYAAIVEQWRYILGQLPGALADNVAWRNAERVYTGSRL